MNWLSFAATFDVKDYFSRLFSPENLPNIGLLVAGVIGIVVAVRTLKILGRQTVAIEKQGDALIDSERASIVAELVPDCTNVGHNWYRSTVDGHRVLSDKEILNGDYLNHTLKLTNMGRTAAHILSYEIEYLCLGDEVTGLSGKVVEAQVGQRPFDQVLGAGQSVEAPETIHVDGYIGNSIHEIEELKKTAVFFGSVKYMHVFSDTEVAGVQFRYVYRPSLKRLEKVPIPRDGLHK